MSAPLPAWLLLGACALLAALPALRRAPAAAAATVLGGGVLLAAATSQWTEDADAGAAAWVAFGLLLAVVVRARRALAGLEGAHAPETTRAEPEGE